VTPARAVTIGAAGALVALAVAVLVSTAVPAAAPRPYTAPTGTVPTPPPTAAR
jgi:hypothetical protein